MSVDERKTIMGDYSTLEQLDLAYGPKSASSWLVTSIANLNAFTGSKNMTNEQTKKLALLLAQEYKDMKYSVVQLFFYRFKCGHFGKFYGKVDPMVITCSLKDFAEECEAKRQEYLTEEYLASRQSEENLRQSVYCQWSEFLRELCSLFHERETRNIVSDIYIDTIFVSDRFIQLSVTKEQYELLEKDNIDAFASVFRKYFPNMSVRYRLRSQKSVHKDVVEDSGKVRKKGQVLPETVAGCHSAHAVIDNIEKMREAFRKRYKHFPEEYLAMYEKK